MVVAFMADTASMDHAANRNLSTKVSLSLQAGNKTSKQILIRRVAMQSKSIAYEMA
jgi:hypothetical protein